jgi:hypothetical protein
MHSPNDIHLLAEHSWTITSPRTAKIDGENALWIEGKVKGVERSAWLMESGIVVLHGGHADDDCHASEFVKRLVVPDVPDEPKQEQGSLF